MATVNIYNQEGSVVETTELPKDLFSCPVNEALVHQVVVSQQANKRGAVAHTKDRSEVRGGGKKPWRQKGTGRARHGSIRSPIWKGGGVTFGPRSERNFTMRINTKMAKKALAMALSDRAGDEHIVVLDTFNLPKLKTNEFVTYINKLPNKNRKTLLLLAKKEKEIKRAVDNVPTVVTHKADSVQALSVITYPYLMMTKTGLEELIKTFSKNTNPKK